MEFLCHDINVHVPHHVSSKIPWYNLRMATDYLRKYYGGVCPPPLCFEVLHHVTIEPTLQDREAR